MNSALQVGGVQEDTGDAVVVEFSFEILFRSTEFLDYKWYFSRNQMCSFAARKNKLMTC